MLYTVGHSTHTTEAFVALLTGAGITAIADVRSSPYSRFNPQHNREPLTAALRAAGIAYVYLGGQLGARRDEPEAYEDDAVRYERVAQLPTFRQGLERVRDGVGRYRVALMCAENDPLDCHRFALICRHLRDMEIVHLRGDGRLEPHAAAEDRLLARFGLPAGDLFSGREAFVERAYDLQGRRLAYRRAADVPEG